MSKEMVVSATPHETRVAILEEGQLCEIYVEREKEFALVGSIYKGRVTRVLPGMQSAFVDIGLDSDAFLYVSDFLEDIEEYDQIVTTVEEKVQKMEEQGGKVFAPEEAGLPAAVEPPDVEAVAGAPAEPLPVQHEETAQAPLPGAVQGPRPREQRPYEGRGYGQGRGGRRHRRGSRGDSRQRGRELPPAKYASHAPHEPRDQESAPYEPSEPHERIVLPGESLAKYKERIPATSQAPAEGSAAPPAVVTEPPPHDGAASVSEHPAERRAERFSSEPEPYRRSFGGIEPLPGESIAKAANRTAPSGKSETVLPEPETHEESGEAAIAEPAGTAIGNESAAQAAEPHNGAELTEEEANALAEQVAEAQLEEEEESSGEENEGSEPENGEGLTTGHTDAAEPDGFAQRLSTPDPTGEMESAEAAVELETEEATEDEAASTENLPAENSPVESQPSKARVRGDFRARMQHPMRRGRREERGRRPQHRQGHRPQQQQRRPQLISEMLKAGQEIIAQIAKEPLGKKGARITSHVALPGRYLVYMPTLDHTGVSRKISSAEERARLRQLVTEAKGSSGGGFIVRTAAERATTEEIRTDVEFLTRTWADIKSRAEQRKAPSLLHRDLNLVERILRDYLSPDYTAIWVDSEEEYTKVVDFVSRFQPQLANRVKLYSKDTPIFEEFGIQQEIDKGLRPKVWLKSGGYIVINHTEALVAIDVNTGKFVGRGSTRLEDTIVRTNLEAVKEIVRQMRLRDLGGIIVIDFIDMEERRNREKVMAALEEALRADRAPSKVLRFNEFGLVAITRKRTKQALERTLCQPCPYCTGSGMVKSVPTICYEIQAEARKMAAELDAQSVTLRVNPEIAKALKTRESSLIEELEQMTRKSIIIQSDATLHWEQYDIY
jgi:ribonuclease G